MDNHFEMGLDELRQKLLTMASHAETAVNQSVQSLMQRNRDLAVRVRADDDLIDKFEIEIDDEQARHIRYVHEMIDGVTKLLEAKEKASQEN